MFIRITNNTDDLPIVLQSDDVVFIKWQISNDIPIRTTKEQAEAIVINGTDFYFFNGYVRDDKDFNVAEEIDEQTYYGYLKETPDPEDEEPVIEEPHEMELPLSREELTTLVRKLQEDNRILTESILEMSEVVYGE